jgi:hypothetical protein
MCLMEFIRNVREFCYYRSNAVDFSLACKFFSLVDCKMNAEAMMLVVGTWGRYSERRIFQKFGAILFHQILSH